MMRTGTIAVNVGFAPHAPLQQCRFIPEPPNQCPNVSFSRLIIGRILKTRLAVVPRQTFFPADRGQFVAVKIPHEPTRRIFAETQMDADRHGQLHIMFFRQLKHMVEFMKIKLSRGFFYFIPGGEDTDRVKTAFFHLNEILFPFADRRGFGPGIGCMTGSQRTKVFFHLHWISFEFVFCFR